MKQRTHKAEALTMRRWYDYQQRAIRQRAHILRPEIKQISKAWRFNTREAKPNKKMRGLSLSGWIRIHNNCKADRQKQGALPQMGCKRCDGFGLQEWEKEL
jgi:hypothetical protein